MHHTGSSLRIGRLCALILCLGSATASAAGLLLPDNGTDVLGRGGTSVGFLDNADALQFNPAGMATGNGLDVRLDLRLANAGETFKPAGQNVTVSNTGGLSFGPEAMVTYRPGAPIARMFGFGLGIWAPPGILRYQFPDPKNFSASNASAQTPQRYNLISQSTIVLYPTLGVAFSPVRFISIGADVQYVYGNTQLSENLQGLPSQLGGNVGSVTNDVNAQINVTSQPRASGIFGLILRPLGDLIPGNDLVISASYRPEQPLTEDGTLSICPGAHGCPSFVGSDLTSLVSVRPDPASATLQIKLPPILRIGANYRFQRLNVSLEWVFEQWSVNNHFLLTTNAELCSANNTKTCASPLPGSASTTIPPVTIVNDWRNAGSIRGGVGYDFLRPKDDGFLLQVNVGVLYETNAIPYETQSLPFITGNQLAVSTGVNFAWHGLGIGGAFMYYTPQSFTVSNSIVEKGSPIPDATPIFIGNGAYTTNYWVFSVGLSYHLDAT
jgi:long-subunit fatty acid transport protein